MFVMSVYEEVSTKVQLINAEQMSLYNFIILRKKRDSEMFSCGIWELKRGHKLAIFNAVLFTPGVERNKQTAETCAKIK